MISHDEHVDTCLKKTQIEEGSTRIPKAQQPTKDLFNGRGPDEEIFKNTLGPVQQGPAKQVKEGPVMQGPAKQAKKIQIDEGFIQDHGRGPDEEIFKHIMGPVKQGPVTQVIEDTCLKKTQIDEGSTRIPKAQQPTKDLFNGP